MSSGKTTKTKKIAMRSNKSGKVVAMKGSKANKQVGPMKRQKAPQAGYAQSKYQS